MISKRCTQCGKQFTLTDSEIEFYKDKDLQIPKRCKACRARSKKRNKKKSLRNSFRKHPLLTALAIILLSFLGVFFNTTDREPQEEILVAEQNKQFTTYEFRNEQYLNEHFEKHKDEFGFLTAQEYLQGANAVINSEYALHKLEAEDGDDVYYLEATNELVVVSTDGYIRTYFKPSDGINYYNRK